MELAHSGDSGVGVGDSTVVGPYMVLDFVDDLPLETPERTGVEITCVEARGILERLSRVEEHC